MFFYFIPFLVGFSLVFGGAVCFFYFFVCLTAAVFGFGCLGLGSFISLDCGIIYFLL